DVQNVIKLCALQRMEHHHLIQSVHELRRELPPRRFNRCPLNLLVQSCRCLIGRLDESHTPLHEIRDLAASQVRGQENHCLRQIHFPVVAQSQRRLIQHPQQQLP